MSIRVQAQERLSVRLARAVWICSLLGLAILPGGILHGQCLNLPGFFDALPGWGQNDDILDLLTILQGTANCGQDGDLGPAPPGPFSEIAGFKIHNNRTVDREGEIAFSGIPLPASLGLTTTGGFAVIGPGDRWFAAQFNVLSRWGGPPDQANLPIRWVQVALPAALEPGETKSYSLRRYDALPPLIDPFAVTLVADGDHYSVDTGLATFALDPANPALFHAIAVDLDNDGTGRVPIYTHGTGAGPKLVFDNGATDVVLDTAQPGTVTVDPGGFEVVESGPVKAAVMLRGHFQDPGGASLCSFGGDDYERYGEPNENLRDDSNRVAISRLAVQHFEMLANCAEFVPGQQGIDCHNRLGELLLELAQDNLAAGILCEPDIPSAATCPQPQIFMQNAMMYHFFHRAYRNYGDVGGNLGRALVEGPQSLYTWALAKQGDGASIDMFGDWAALLDCTLTAGGTQVQSCTAVPNSDGLYILTANKPHTLAMLLMAHEIDPNIGLCGTVKSALDSVDVGAFWDSDVWNPAGWYKATSQMIQAMAFAVGLYDSCADP